MNSLKNRMRERLELKEKTESGMREAIWEEVHRTDGEGLLARLQHCRDLAKVMYALGDEKGRLAEAANPVGTRWKKDDAFIRQMKQDGYITENGRCVATVGALDCMYNDWESMRSR